MIIKVNLDTNQEIEIYNSLNDMDKKIKISYREVFNEKALSLTNDSNTETLLLYNSWKNLIENIENPMQKSAQSIVIIDDNNKIIFEKNNITNYAYSVTFDNTIKENINFEFIE